MSRSGASEFYHAAKGDRERLDAMNDKGIRKLDPEDVAAATLFVIDVPRHVNVALIELLPTDQTVGDVRLNTTGN